MVRRLDVPSLPPRKRNSMIARSMNVALLCAGSFQGLILYVLQPRWKSIIAASGREIDCSR